jgi:hypothetical protein
MKSFQQFITEAYEKDLAYQATRKPGEGGRIRTSRKKREVEKKRTKVVGGKRVPVDYKPRKDIGTNKPKSQTQQQPTKERGSVNLSAKEAQKKAYRERKARESGAKTKTADQLLSKKTTKKADPKYKPQKASGHTPSDRKAIIRKGERKLRNLRLKNLGKETEIELKHPITQKEITRRNKKK